MRGRAGDERRARGAEDKRRAQMHLAQLGWLEGFAANGRWYVVEGEPTERALDGLLLSRARRAVNTLRRDHAAALEILVDDASSWLARVDAVLTTLGRHVHGGAAAEAVGELAPPRVRQRARALERAHPRLRPLLWAAISAWVLQPDRLAAGMAWMERRARSLVDLAGDAEPPALRRGLQLVRQGSEDERGTDALLALMRTDVEHPSPAAMRVEVLLRQLRGQRTASMTAVSRRTGSVLVAWADDLLQRPAADRERALALLAAVDLAGALAPWREWEAEHGSRIERAHAFVAQGIDSGPSIDHVRRVIGGITRAVSARPRPLNLDEVLAAILGLAEARREPFHRAALRLLSARGAWESPRHRAHFVSHAASVEANDEGDPRAAWLWEAVAAELARGASSRILDPWKKVIEGKPGAWLEPDLLEEQQRPAEVKRLAGALARVAADRPATALHARRLGPVLAAGVDVAAAAALICRLETFEAELSEPLVRAAVCLVGQDDSSALARGLRTLSTRRGDFGPDGEETLAALCEHAAAAGHEWLIHGLLEHDTARLAEIVALATAARRRSWPKLDGAAGKPRWIADYPAALHEALARLARVDPDPESTARRRLAADLPDPETLAREAAVLRTRPILGPREAVRLQRLEARLASPKVLSPVRLARLAGKLEAAAARSGGERLAEALRVPAQERVLASLGLETWPEELVDRRHWPILVALTRLDARQRALAGRLLRARSGPPPWDLRDDPVNLKYLARLRARGIDPTAWLDDAPRVVTGGDGHPVELGLCSDPLEVFAMGAHFRTCLSPDASNFFSVVTNAADVNKRVLYARRGGKILGRCLLAITDSGDVLTFHAYAHEARLGFHALVRDYAFDLASRMGGRVATAGRVSLLLGRDWYDDGARDLVGRYEALESADFVRAILDVAPSGLIRFLEAAMGRPVDDITLPVVLDMPALSRRPSLIEALAPYLLAQPALPEHTLLTAARLAMNHGDLALADRLLTGLSAQFRFEHSVWEVGRVLARTRPSFTLARLRQTRARGVRAWNEEHGERVAVAGLALEMLRRPRQAAALYRQAIAGEPWLEDELRPRIAALEEATLSSVRP